MATRKPKPNAERYPVSPSPIQVGLRGCCPRCGKGRLFVGMFNPAASCTNCGESFDFVDSGDGPAVFVILIVGFLVTAFAMALQSAINPPIWVHMIVWIPIVALFSLASLRFSKGVMIALQYKTGAKQGELRRES